MIRNFIPFLKHFRLFAICLLFFSDLRSQFTDTAPAFNRPDTFKVKFRNNKPELMPVLTCNSLLTPFGWSGSGLFIFGFWGGTTAEYYSKSTWDLVSTVGFGFGNPSKSIGIIASLNINDVSDFSNISYNLHLSRKIARGTNLAIGGFHLLNNPRISDAGASWYIVVSHASQKIKSAYEGRSRLTASVGFGTNRFLKKSEYDIMIGRAKYGTGIFGNISYEFAKNLNVGVDWTGTNLGTSIAWRPLQKFTAISLGIADITRLSADRPRFVFGIGHSILLN